MEVVLLENIKNLGKIGDIVNVKRGHGRNFLIKYGKALKASKDNIDLVNKKKDDLNIKNVAINSSWYIRSAISTKKGIKINEKIIEPTEPDIVLFGLIFVSFFPLKIFPTVNPPISDIMETKIE